MGLRLLRVGVDPTMLLYPIGLVVQKTPRYPLSWTCREFNKSGYGVVVGYARGYTKIRVLRDGTKTPLECDPTYWEPFIAASE